MQPQTFLSCKDISLGRLVTDTEYPCQDFFDPQSDVPLQNSSKTYHQYQAAESDSKDSNIGAKLLQLLSLKRAREENTNIEINSERVTTHLLSNYRAWFADIIQQQSTRKWIENALKSDKIYLVVGYHTALNPRVSESRNFSQTDAVNGTIPVSGAIAASTGVMLPSDVVDPAVEIRRLNGGAASQAFEDEGESVFAVMYRELKFKRHSSRQLREKPLGSNMWIKYSTFRSGTRGPAGTDDSDVQDVLEAELAEDDPVDEA